MEFQCTALPNTAKDVSMTSKSQFALNARMASPQSKRYVVDVRILDEKLVPLATKLNAHPVAWAGNPVILKIVKFVPELCINCHHTCIDHLKNSFLLEQ